MRFFTTLLLILGLLSLSQTFVSAQQRELSFGIYDSTNSPLPGRSMNKAGFPAITESPTGNIWIGGATNGNSYLAKYDGSNWEDFGGTFPCFNGSGNISDIAIDSNQTLWIASNSDGIIEFNPNGPGCELYNPYNRGVGDIEIDSKNQVWFANGRDGLARNSNDPDTSFTKWTPNNSDIPGDQINELAIDSNDNIWLAIDATGLAKFDPDDTTWTLWTESNSPIQNPNNNIMDVAVSPGGNVWFSDAWDNVYQMEDSNLIKVYHDGNSNFSGDSPTNDFAFGDDGSVWALTNQTLQQFQNGTWGPVYDGTHGSGLANVNGGFTIFSELMIDKKGLSWIGIGKTVGNDDEARDSVYVSCLADHSMANTCLDKPASFTNRSEVEEMDSTQWEWHFGDGNTDDQESPVHKYGSSGSFDTWLISKDTVTGCIDTSDTATIDVHPIPYNGFTAAEVCNGDTMHFNDTTQFTGDTLHYTWAFGDGDTSTMIAPSHVYADTGDHVVTLMTESGKGCTDTLVDTVRVNPHPFVDSVNAMDATGCGAKDGKAWVSDSSGFIPYQYQWSNGASSDSVSGLASGNYTVTVTNSHGCVFVDSVTIGQPQPPTLSMSGQDVSCSGAHDGSVTANPKGGAQPYTYNWSTGDTTPQIDSLPAGSYSVIVTDSNGCTVTGSYTVESGSPITLDVTTTDATCNTADGNASVTVNGGTSPYEYVWSSGDTTAQADSLSAGNYTLQVTDVNGCQATTELTIDDATGPSVSLNSKSDVMCPGDADGSIDIDVTGGTPPYSYEWSNGMTTEDITSLQGGTYTVKVTDTDKCVKFLSVEVNEPDPLDLKISTDPAFCGNQDGEATVSVSGGTAPYSYQWSSGGTSATETGLGVGNYVVVVTDSAGCKATATASVGDNGGVDITVDAVQHTQCGNADGAVFISVSGGAPPYDYQWSNGSSKEDIVGLDAGDHSVTVTDDNGCGDAANVEVEGKTPKQTNICMVTVDSATGHNKVVWEQSADTTVVEYNIYRESANAGQYTRIATVPEGTLSTYLDTSSNPDIKAYRYKITSVDSCGEEAPLSPMQKTIHLTANKGLNNKVNLIWDDYVGYNYSTFYINRYTPSSGWMTIDSVSANSNSFTDNNVPSTAQLTYEIEVNAPAGGCLATKSEDYNSSRSNRKNISGPTSVTSQGPTKGDVELWPNPTDGRFTLGWDKMDVRGITVYDVFGKAIKEVSGNDLPERGTHTMNLQEASPGLYFIRVESGDEVIRKPVVVE